MWKFLISSSQKSNWPSLSKKEICFIGRSNVGKSSLINALMKRNKLARVSNTPGRTQLINFFSDGKHVIVDLPGYGYAKISQKQKIIISKMINQYFFERKELIYTFILIDSKVGPTKYDLEMLEFLEFNNKLFTIVLTKSDKINQSQKAETTKKIEKLQKKFIFTSSTKNHNIDQLKKLFLDAFYQK